MSTQELQLFLADRGLVAPEEIRAAEETARGTASSWLEQLILAGMLDEEKVCQEVARTYRLSRCPRSALAAVPAAVIALLPPEIAAEHHAVPIEPDADGDLRLAMQDPTDMDAVTEIQFFTGRRVIREVARATDVAKALHRYYGVVTQA